MHKKLCLIIFYFFLSIPSYSQPTDSIITQIPTQYQNKTRRYDATQYCDTLIVENKKYIVTKKELKDNFRNYTRGFNDTIVYNGDTLTTRKVRQLVVKNNKDSIRAHKNVWTSILGGPSYTPESSLGIGGAVILSFKTNTKDSLLKRSTIPFGFLASVNSTFMLSGRAEFYFKENNIQINTSYGFSYAPNNYYGVGFDQIDKNYKSDSTTLYTSFQVKFRPIVSFKITDKILLGSIIDYTYYRLEDVNPKMEMDPNYIKYGDEFLIAGIGLNFRYDSRDNNTMPYSGMRINASSVAYREWLGSVSNYTYTSIDYRQYQRLFDRRSVLSWTARVDIATGDVPFTELPSFGGPFDLRGYDKGHFRDNTMGYFMTEYRHMFGSEAVYNHRRPLYSRLGFAVWGAVASVGPSLTEWDQAKWNYGVGLRYEVQPNTNFRLDIGKSQGAKPLIYMNITEAF